MNENKILSNVSSNVSLLNSVSIKQEADTTENKTTCDDSRYHSVYKEEMDFVDVKVEESDEGNDENPVTPTFDVFDYERRYLTSERSLKTYDATILGQNPKTGNKRKEKTRERGSNFTAAEATELLRIIEGGYLKIVENKKTDHLSTETKNDAWMKITNSFNALGLGPPRDAKSLRAKYDTMKRNLRKSGSEWRPTDGGPQPTEKEISLWDHMAMNMRSVQSNPSDSNSGFSAEPRFVNQEVPTNDGVGVLESGDSSSSMTRTSIDPTLKFVSSNLDGNVLNNRSTSPPPANFANCRSPVTMDIAASPRAISDPHLAGTPAASQTIPRKTSAANISRRRQMFNRKRSMSSAAAKFEELAEKKLLLVETKQEVQNLEKKRAEFDCKKAELEFKKAELEYRKLAQEMGIDTDQNGTVKVQK